MSNGRNGNGLAELERRLWAEGCTHYLTAAGAERPKKRKTAGIHGTGFYPRPKKMPVEAKKAS